MLSLSEFPPSQLWPAIYHLTPGRTWPPQTPAQADALIEEAKRQFLLPLLFAATRMPDVVRDRLNAVRALERLNFARVATFDSELEQLRDALQGEDFILLKGFDYARRLYPASHLRPMGDLDILVPRKRVSEVRSRLLAAGMKQKWPGGPASRLEMHHEHVFTSELLMVEVHHAFIQRVRNTIDYDAIWRRRVPFPGLHGVFRLSDSDALSYHALSMSNDEFSVRFIRWLDLLLLLRAAPDSLDEAVVRAHEWKADRALFGTLHLAARVFPELSFPLTDQLLRPSVRSFLKRYVLPDPFREPGGHETGRARQLWRKFWLLDSASARIRLAAFFLYVTLAGRLHQRFGKTVGWIASRRRSSPAC